MCPDKNKQLVRDYYEKVASGGDVDLIPQFISPDYVEVHEGTRHEIGIEGAKKHILGVHQVYSGLELTVDRQIAEGEWVVSCVTVRGKHVGHWIGIAPTGREVTMTGVNVDRVVDGLIVEHGGAANMLLPLMEIGAVAPVGTQGG